MSDIKQHPLWREHHGDMTGWRYLEVREVKLIDDEFIDQTDASDKWEIGVCSGSTVAPKSACAFRRRIAPIPEAPKRFVTVVVKMTDVHALDRIKAVSVVEEIREGNYLEKFDGMKERVSNAMEGEG